jgi:predicted O-linked N-acetylglucosamine transferase (SPINDLY family)
MGLPELVADSVEAYEALALKLATDPALLAEVKARIARNRHTAALFDTDAFTRNLEAIYTAMWRKTELCGAQDALS